MSNAPSDSRAPVSASEQLQFLFLVKLVKGMKRPTLTSSVLQAYFNTSGISFLKRSNLGMETPRT